MRSGTVSVLIVAALGAANCRFDPLERCAPAQAGDRLSCAVPGRLDRAFDLDVPRGWDGTSPLPLLIAFHGGGGNRRSAERVTCPRGDESDPGCLSARASARGYAVALPDGTGSRPTRNVRTWNAGGGRDGWNCVSGPACRAGADDMRYFDELMAEIARAIPVDPRRVFATGLSNGGAISHRLACERADDIAAIAPVDGANQFVAAGGACKAGAAVMHIHGTEDPCWTYEQSDEGCLDLAGGQRVSAPASTEDWAERNGCGAVAEEALPDVDPTDGTTVTRLRWQGCTRAVELIRINGGGHTWPRGYAYFGTDHVGRVSNDIEASTLILDFFDANPRP